jgi:hypothetical protein
MSVGVIAGSSSEGSSPSNSAHKVGRMEEVRELIRALVASETSGARLVTRVLGRDLGL